MKIRHYTLLKATSSFDLEDQVLARSADGWILAGGVSVIGGYQQGEVYFQAMYKTFNL